MRCERCGRDTLSHTMSMFNTQTICLECKEIKENHPDYERAREAEMKAVQRGDYNFRGIGLPADLR